MHYHIMVRDPKAMPPIVFKNIKASCDKEALYSEFRDCHNGRPDMYRFSWCTSEECELDD